MSTNYWFYALVHLTSLPPSWPSSAPTSSSSPASSTFIPWRAGPKASAHAAPTSQLPLCMDLQHLCTCSHHLWAPWTKGKCPLCFILLCPCWIPWSTASGIKMSMLPWRKCLREHFCDQTWNEHDILDLVFAHYIAWIYGSERANS